MRVLAALAALHVILACPDGQCDEVEMLQSSVSQVKDSATFQLSAMVHGGKQKSKPEAKQSAVSAHSPQPAEEKPSQLAEEKPAEEKSHQSAKEKSPQSDEEEDAEESLLPDKEKSAQLPEEKPAEEKSPKSAEEKPAEEESAQSAEEKPAEEESAQLAEEKPAEEKSPQSAEEEPAEEKPPQWAEQEPPEEESLEEKSAQLAEEEPAEETSPQSAEEEPAEEESLQSAKEKSAQLAEEEPAEEKSPQSAEEEPAEEKSPQSAEKEPAEETAEEKPAEEKSAQFAETKPAEEKSPQSAEEKPTGEKSPQSAEKEPAGEKSPQSAEKEPAGEKPPQSAEEREIDQKKDWNKMMEVALLLARARDSCKDFADGQCLTQLKEYRRHAWPFIEKELGKNLTFFKVKGPQGMMNGWRPFFLKTRLRGCVEHPVIYMQVKGVQAKNLVTNLRKHSNRRSAIKTGHIDKEEICRATKNKKTVGVTFVRDPLDRFISAYEELVAFRRHRPKWAKKWAAFLEEEEKSSTEHARLFIENFLQGRGKDITASILPQVEYFVETANNCSARMSFVGKSESPADEWQRLIHDMGCDPAKIPYLNATGTGPPRRPHKHAHKHAVKKANKTSSLLQVSSGATSGIEQVMKQNNSAYLRAWCWFSMPDYVLLKYDLPAECQDLLDGFVV